MHIERSILGQDTMKCQGWERSRLGQVEAVTGQTEGHLEVGLSVEVRSSDVASPVLVG